MAKHASDKLATCPPSHRYKKCFCCLPGTLGCLALKIFWHNRKFLRWLNWETSKGYRARHVSLFSQAFSLDQPNWSIYTQTYSKALENRPRHNSKKLNIKANGKCGQVNGPATHDRACLKTLDKARQRLSFWVNMDFCRLHHYLLWRWMPNWHHSEYQTVACGIGKPLEMKRVGKKTIF